MELSAVSQLGINASKTKEILISFCKVPTVENLYMKETVIERVSESKLPGVITCISEDHNWGKYDVNYN
jgi:hypothetical protein